MAFSVDNQTLLYIVIGLFIVNILVMRYYVNSSIDDSLHRNNKKITKTVTKQIDMLFEKYVGSQQQQQPQYENTRSRKYKQEEDSIEDPAEKMEQNQDDETE